MKALLIVAALAAGGCASMVPNAPMLLNMKAEGVARVYTGPEESVWAAARATLHSFGGLVEVDRDERTLLSSTPNDAAHLAAWIDAAPEGWRVTFISRSPTPLFTGPREKAMHARLSERLATR